MEVNAHTHADLGSCLTGTCGVQTEDLLMLLHWATSARAGGLRIAVPSGLQMSTRREMLRVFALACLTARQNRDPLLGYAPIAVPALHAHASSPLSAIGAQVYKLVHIALKHMPFS